MGLPESNIARIAYLCAQRVPQNTIAAAVGISPGRLSQLIATSSELQAAIQQAEATNVDKDVARAVKLEDVEDKLLAALPALIDPDFLSLKDAVGALHSINALRRSNANLTPTMPQGVGTGIQVNLSIVAQQQINVVLAPNNAILELGDTDVTPMPRDLVGGFLDALPVQSRFAPSGADEPDV